MQTPQSTQDMIASIGIKFAWSLKAAPFFDWASLVGNNPTMAPDQVTRASSLCSYALLCPAGSTRPRWGGWGLRCSR